MGMFLSLSGIIGKTKNEVLLSLTNFAKSCNGSLEKENLTLENDNCGVVKEANGNTTIYYPNYFLDWDKSSEFISRELNAPVFSFHIHDGDLWMYTLYYDGQIVDQFNPIPDYWSEDISKEEIESWKGNALTITKYIPYVKPKDIENYLVRWDLKNEEELKAYPEDEFVNEDWQLLDFMKKLRFDYPLDENGNAKGETFKMWTKENALVPDPKTLKFDNKENISIKISNKPWWKFW